MNPASDLLAVPETRLDYAKASPGVVEAMLGLEKHVRACGLERPLLELVKMRASQINGCAFCLNMHAEQTLAAGETITRLNLIAAWEESPVFTPRERAALLWTESLTEIATTRAPDEVFAAVRAQFTDKELADLTLAIVAINGWNRFSVAFRRHPDIKS